MPAWHDASLAWCHLSLPFHSCRCATLNTHQFKRFVTKSLLIILPKISTFATWLAFYRSQKGLSLENSEKSPKRGSRGLSGRGRKNPKKSRKWLVFNFFSSFRPVFNLFFDFSWAFPTPGPRGPGNPFSDFFGSFLGRGLSDSCRRPTMSQKDSTCNSRVFSMPFSALCKWDLTQAGSNGLNRILPFKACRGMRNIGMTVVSPLPISKPPPYQK